MECKINLMNKFGMKLKKASLLTIILLCAGLAPVGAQNTQPAATPDALIKELYKVHNQGKGPIFAGKRKVYLQKFFDKKLADLLWKILTTKTDEVGLDFDPLFNAQDFQITNFRISAPTGDDQKSIVTVTFRNAKQPETIKFRLNHTPN